MPLPSKIILAVDHDPTSGNLHTT